MPYIGNDLATQFQAFATQTITGDGSTGYTLDRAVANGKELLVYINNVKQEEGSGKSYTASGTTITFSEAVASGDSCYLVYMGSAQQTVTAPAGSIVSGQFSSADLSLTGNLGIGITPDSISNGNALQVNRSVINDDDGGSTHITQNAYYDSAWKYVENGTAEKITFATGATTFSNATSNSSGADASLTWVDNMTIDANGNVLKPKQTYFKVRKNANQDDFATGTNVVVTFETEDFDVGGNFASNAFTAPVTGIYLFHTTLRLQSMETASNYFSASINTSNREYRWIEHFPTIADKDYFTVVITAIVDMDANDTANVRIYQHSSTQQTDVKEDSTRTLFYGYLLG